MRNLNIFLKCGCKVGAGCGSACLPFGVSTGPRIQDLSGIQDMPEVCSAPLVVRSLLLSALSLCACRVACKYAFIWHFKGVFSVVYGFGVGLCCFGALRGLWGFCTRV